MSTVPFRIGHGFDVHRFGPGKSIVLGGVRIPYEKGFIAHSDGDVLIHALIDALLGAAGLGDIGRLFPDTDQQYENICSRLLLQRVMSLLAERGYRVVNVDMTIVAQAPRLAPFVDQMRDNLADELSVDNHDVNVKATTTEKLGFEGRKEGVSAHAVALICRGD